MTNKTKRGFTLIELLVVISIMGLLSSVVLTAVNSARVKARDTQRIQALEEIRKALTLYYHDNGKYPISNGSTVAVALSRPTGGNVNWNSLQAALVPTYIPALPVDPINTPSGGGIITGTAYAYRYSVSATGDNYNLVALLETASPLRCGAQLSKAYVTESASIIAGSPWCSASDDISPYSRQLYSVQH